MILVDANLLLYAHFRSFSQHERARTWLDAQLNGSAQVGLPWPSLLAFVRIASNPRVFESPSSVADAWRQVEEWLAAPAAWVPTPSSRHADVLAELLPHVSRSELVPDAHLAALAVEHGLSVASTDGDFALFSGARWENPLAPPPARAARSPRPRRR